MRVSRSIPRRVLPFALALALTAGYCSPASAFLFQQKEEDPNATVAAFGKNGLTTEVFSFSQSDTLTGILVTSLPSVEAGVLQVGSELVSPGDTILTSALDSLRFFPTADGPSEACFTFVPIFATGTAQEEVTVDLYLLAEENRTWRSPASSPPWTRRATC